jgi:hypothetical protein
MAWAETSFVFVSGVLRRYYFWLPAFLLDPFDFYAKYIQPTTQRELDIPDEWFPFALGIGLFIAVIGTAQDLRTRPPGTHVTFDLVDYDLDVYGFRGDRSDTPCDQLQLSVSGSLHNHRGERTPIDGIDVITKQRWRRFLPLWRSVRTPTVFLIGGMGGRVDPFYHGVHVDGHTRSRAISKVEAHIALPPGVKNHTELRSRLRVLTPSGRNQGATTVGFDISEALELGESTDRRIHREGPSTQALSGE